MIKDYRKYVVNAVLAFFTYLAFLIYFKIIFNNNSYNFILLLLYFLIFVFYNKYRKKDKNLIISVLSFLLSFILIIGSIVYSQIEETTERIFIFHRIGYSIIGVFGFYILFKTSLKILFDKLKKINFSKKQVMNKKTFILIFVFIVICYIPYFLRYFPAVMTPDSYYSIHYVENYILNDFHALGHTWFFGVFYLLGKVLFHTMNNAVAFYIIIQMLLCAFIFTYVVKFLYEKGIDKVFLLLTILFLALSPLFAIYSVTLWRDILFGMAFATLFIAIYNFVDNNYKITKSNLILYILSILVILFFRNNGIYVFLLFLPFFIYFSKNRKVLLLGNFAIILIYIMIKGPIFSYFNVEKTTSVEAFSIPLQQISRVVVNDANIDEESYKYINSVMDINKIKETYVPTISDSVKRSSDNAKISENKLKFLTTWVKLGIQNPSIYIESYLCSTLGYYYPDTIYWATANESKSIFKDVKVYSDPKGPKFLKNIDILLSRKIPLSNILWSIGTMFIILLTSTAFMIYKNKTRYLLAFLPLYSLWASLMLATPVFSELRYIYGLFVCLPLILFVPFIKAK